jgi:arylformamidase
MKRFIDLSHTITNGMTTYPGLPGPVITDHLTREASHDHYALGTEFQIGRIEMVANTGTYLDTPFHRYSDGYDLTGLALERVADLEGICVAVVGQEVGVESLEGIEVGGMAVLFHTGWDRHWGTLHYGDSSHHPYLSEGAAALLAEAGPALVGIDSVNIDDTRGDTRPAHSALLSNGIPIVEHLTGLESLHDVSFRFFAVPPRIRGMGTFPVRAFALA